jgi:hypothetical protein
MNKDDKSAFRPILSNLNPFFSPSNDFHAHLALLRPFLSIPSLTFWQTFPFLRPPEFIPPPSPIRPKATTHISSKPSLTNLIHSKKETTKSKNCKKYKCDVCSRAFSRSNTLVTHKVFVFVSFIVIIFSSSVFIQVKNHSFVISVIELFVNREI